MLDSKESSNVDDFLIQREEVETAIESLKTGIAGTNNIPAELIKHGGEAVIDNFTLQYHLANWRMANTLGWSG